MKKNLLLLLSSTALLVSCGGGGSSSSTSSSSSAEPSSESSQSTPSSESSQSQPSSQSSQSSAPASTSDGDSKGGDSSKVDGSGEGSKSDGGSKSDDSSSEEKEQTFNEKVVSRIQTVAANTAAQEKYGFTESAYLDSKVSFTIDQLLGEELAEPKTYGGSATFQELGEANVELSTNLETFETDWTCSGAGFIAANVNTVFPNFTFEYDDETGDLINSSCEDANFSLENLIAQVNVYAVDHYAYLDLSELLPVYESVDEALAPFADNIDLASFESIKDYLGKIKVSTEAVDSYLSTFPSLLSLGLGLGAVALEENPETGENMLPAAINNLLEMDFTDDNRLLITAELDNEKILDIIEAYTITEEEEEPLFASDGEIGEIGYEEEESSIDFLSYAQMALTFLDVDVSVQIDFGEEYLNNIVIEGSLALKEDMKASLPSLLNMLLGENMNIASVDAAIDFGFALVMMDPDEVEITPAQDLDLYEEIIPLVKPEPID